MDDINGSVDLGDKHLPIEITSKTVQIAVTAHDVVFDHAYLQVAFDYGDEDNPDLSGDEYLYLAAVLDGAKELLKRKIRG